MDFFATRRAHEYSSVLYSPLTLQSHFTTLFPLFAATVADVDMSNASQDAQFVAGALKKVLNDLDTVPNIRGVSRFRRECLTLFDGQCSPTRSCVAHRYGLWSCTSFTSLFAT